MNIKEQEARGVIEEMIQRRMDNTGETRDESIKHIIRYLESINNDTH